MRLRVLIALIGMTSTAWAGDDAALQAQVFGHPLDKDNGYACFMRQYTAEHLASHPHQNVTDIVLLLTGKPKPDVSYTAGVDFTFRKHKKHFQAYGDCPSVSADTSAGSDQKLACGIDCDGGTIGVKLKDANTVLVSLPDGASSPDDSSSAHFGTDDSLFKLTRAPARNCLPLAGEDADKAALKKLP